MSDTQGHTDGLVSGGLILASASPARRDILIAAGVAFDVRATHLDERAIKGRMAGQRPEDIAMTLARAKALKAARQTDQTLMTCIGADQILVLEGRLFDKPEDMAAARRTLIELRGKTHKLISAVAMARGDSIIWEYSDVAELEMRDFSDTFLDDYLESAGEDVLTSVGAYRLEGLGVQLFVRIDGSHTTILGLPLLPLLAALRAEGFVAA